MCQIALNVPNEVLYDIKMTQEDIASFIKKIVALNFYTKAGISLGYCAQIAEMDKEDFIHYLSSNGISIFHFDNEEEFIEEMNNA